RICRSSRKPFIAKRDSPWYGRTPVACGSETGRYLGPMTSVILLVRGGCTILGSPTTEPGRRGWDRRLGSPISAPILFSREIVHNEMVVVRAEVTTGESSPAWHSWNRHHKRHDGHTKEPRCLRWNEAWPQGKPSFPITLCCPTNHFAHHDNFPGTP